VLNEKIPGININVRSTGGVAHNMRLLEKSEIDIGAIDTKICWEAIHGEGSYAGKPFKDLRLLYVSQTNKLQIVVSEKSGIKDVYGLEGKLFCPGPLGSSTETIAQDIFRILGVHPKIRHASLADGVEQMKNEMVLGLGKMGAPPDATVMDIASALKIRLLSFKDGDIEKVVNNVVGLRKGRIAAGIYAGVGEVNTLENEWADIVRTDFPADLAYKIVKTLWTNRAAIQKVYPNFVADQMTEVALGVKTVYLHPGAVKFYRELGLTVPKILIPPEMGEK
jgi:hypothetical protein